jgi:hypothetical protein
VAWAPWRFVGEQRFDDPVHQFRVLYTAQQRLGCFVEAVARFRIPVPFLAAIQAQPGGTQQLPRPRIPEDWLRQRCLGQLHLLAGQNWLDLRAPETCEVLRQELAPVLVRLGMGDLDVSGARGPSRALTQAIARWAFERGYHGIAYKSRFSDALDCWALFEGAAFERVGQSERLAPDDADLLAAAHLFGLEG